MAGPTLLIEVVTTSATVAATRSRTAKRDALAALLRALAPEEVEAATGFLIGEVRQGRVGVGWRTLGAAETEPATAPSLTVAEVDSTIDVLAGLSGPGSATRRRDELARMLGRATADEAWFLVRLLGGELRQGALSGVMADAIAVASGVPATEVRRAAMFGGDLRTIARVALVEGPEGLAAVGLAVGRPLQPMLASTADSVTDAVRSMGEVAVEWKLDGIRIQVHRHGSQISVFTRNLNDITARVPEVVAVAAGLRASRVVLDGEVLVLDGDRPLLFQDTASRVSADEARGTVARPYFFDLLHLDGLDLTDRPLSERRRRLAELVGPHAIPGTETSDPEAGEKVLAEALAAGHEGVVVKSVASTYEAGRRGKAWRKVKPVKTLDLVVLAAEWGHGRRSGWLSNLHLGARSAHGAGFVMVGKTFKGMTDELLAWQTEALQKLKEGEERTREAHVVHVRPELVVEITLDGVQRSTRYEGGVALRFARVLRYRPDKSADEADTITTVRALGRTS